MKGADKIMIKFVIIFIGFQLIGGIITGCIWYGISERRKKAYANLPKETLLMYALMSPELHSDYWHARMVVPKDEADDLIINRLLIEQGLIGYRKES